MLVKLIKNKLQVLSYLLSLTSLLIIFHPCTLLAASTTTSPDSTLTPYHGTAFDLERKTPAYSEVNCENYHNGKLLRIKTTFSGQDGKPLARKNLNFEQYPYKPDYVFNDERTGYEEGAKVESQVIVVHYRDSTHAPLCQKSIQVPEPCIINGGVGIFIKQNWEKLMAGNRLAINMVIPARLDYYGFVVYGDVTKTLPIGETGGRETKAIVVAPTSSILKFLISPIVIYYDVKTLRMIRYQGIVNLTDAKGRSLRVKIDYPELGP